MVLVAASVAGPMGSRLALPTVRDCRHVGVEAGGSELRATVGLKAEEVGVVLLESERRDQIVVVARWDALRPAHWRRSYAR